MRSSKVLRILHSITEACLGSAIIDDAPLISQVSGAGWKQRLSRAIQEELEVTITVDEVQSADSLLQLSDLLASRLPEDFMGRSLVEIYATLERIAREEYHPNIDYHWYARWNDFLTVGNWLTVPDTLDAAEMVMRMEEEFGFSIPNQDAEAMQTVGHTVRYVWQRSCTQNFALRQPTRNVCPNVFIFHELRRLLIIRGAIPRAAARLDVSLGDLLPSWHAQFWKQVESIFHVDLPQNRSLVFNRKVEKRITLKEMVSLIASSQKTRDESLHPDARHSG